MPDRSPNHRPRRRMGQVTLPILIAFGIILFCVLGFVWALYGFLPALAAAYLVDQGIRTNPARRTGIAPRDGAP